MLGHTKGILKSNKCLLFPSGVREPDNSEFSIHSFFTAVTTTVVCLVAEMALL